MIGKFVLIAIFCVSLAQVQGNALEDAIKNGINKVTGLYEEGQRNINNSIDVVGYKRKAVTSKTIAINLKSGFVQQGTKKALREVAQSMEEKAQALNKTEEVFACIKKTEQAANKQIETLTNEFKASLKTLENATLAKIQTESKPLGVMQEALKLEYQNVVKKIQACKNTNCINSAVAGCAKWLEEMKTETGRILGQIGNIVGLYGRDSGDLFRKYSSQVNQIKSNGIRDIKKCVFG